MSENLKKVLFFKSTTIPVDIFSKTKKIFMKKNMAMGSSPGPPVGNKLSYTYIMLTCFSFKYRELYIISLGTNKNIS